eukprot:3794360-Rhodomonas_salina.2
MPAFGLALEPGNSHPHYLAITSMSADDDEVSILGLPAWSELLWFGSLARPTKSWLRSFRIELRVTEQKHNGRRYQGTP